MSYPDEDVTWVGYPGICQSISTKIRPKRLSIVDRTIDGNIRVTRPSEYMGVDITVVHNKISDADKNRIFDYYELVKNLKFKFLYRGDLHVYRVAFTEQPDKTWIGTNDSGSIWNVTSKLSGIYEYTEA